MLHFLKCVSGYQKIIAIFSLVLGLSLLVLGGLTVFHHVHVETPPSPIIASFDHGIPTDWGADWVTFNDSKNGYKSRVFLTADQALRLEVSLSAPTTEASTPYAGISTYYSPKPHRIYDFSDFDGISLELRVIQKTPGLQCVLQLVDTSTLDLAWHQAIIPLESSTHYVPFSAFQQPDWYLKEKQPLNLKKMYRLAIFFTHDRSTAKPANGVVLIDMLKLQKNLASN